MKLLITKQFDFQMAHSLACYPGKCRNLHGHNYKLFVTVTHTAEIKDMTLNIHGSPEGMVMDFGEIKSLVEKHIIETFDHALVVPQGSPFATIEGTKKIVTDFEPTSENLLFHFAALLSPHLPEGVRLHSLKLHETDSSSAELIFD